LIVAAPDTQNISTGTLAGFDEFITWLISKGLMRSAAAEPLRSATRQIMLVVEPDNPDLDLRTVDTEDVMGRFEKLAGHKYAPESLRSYANRFNRGIALYRQYLDNGASNFKPPAGRKVRPRVAQPGSSSDSPVMATVGPRRPEATPTQSLIDYPFPLRSGGIAHLYLPAKLEMDDADRLAAYVRALVFEPQRQLAAGED
jgi:hypothetical protein